MVLEKYVVETPTQKEFDAIIKYCEDNHLRGMDKSYWSYYGVDTCVSINSTGNEGYSSKEFYSQAEQQLIHGPLIPYFVFANLVGIWYEGKTEELKVGDYTAVVDYKEEVVKVGCQTIPFSVVETVYKLTIKYKE